MLAAIRSRRSYPSVTEEAPSHEALLPLVAAAARLADHGSLKPWRLIELRGQARAQLGVALAEASDDARRRSATVDTATPGTAAPGAAAAGAAEAAARRARLMAKPLRAPLLIAIVVVHRPSLKVADWEQDAAAAGVAHALSLLLDDAGWGVMWRTGLLVRSDRVRQIHRLTADEQLLGWLYVGGRPPDAVDHKPRDFRPEQYLSRL